MFLCLPHLEKKVDISTINQLFIDPYDLPFAVKIEKFLKAGRNPEFYKRFTFKYLKGSDENEDVFPHPCSNGTVYVGMQSGRIWTVEAPSADHAIDCIMQMIVRVDQIYGRRQRRLGELLNYHIIHLDLEHVCKVVLEDEIK